MRVNTKTISAAILCLMMSFGAAAQKRHPIDTVMSPDSLARIVIMSDQSWEYLGAESNDDNENWIAQSLTPFRISLADLPDTVILDLVDSMGIFCSPVVGAPSSHYGIRWNRRHTGTDIPKDTGTPVRAAFDGIVNKAEYYGGYGNCIIVRHINGMETYYGHLSQIHVEQGEWVTAGQVIGLVGSTGHSTGPHLHFETRYKGYPFDPERLVSFDSGELLCDHFALRKSYFGSNSKAGFDDQSRLDSISAKSKQAAAKPATPSKQYYTVREGDNLSKIAKKYHTTVGQICALNKLNKDKTIRPGQKLRIK